MRTIDEEAQLILSDPASSEQLRRMAKAVVDYECDCSEAHDDCVDAYDHRKVEEKLAQADILAETLKRDLEADRRHSTKLRALLDEAAELFGNSHNTHAVEWRAKYLALSRE